MNPIKLHSVVTKNNKTDMLRHIKAKDGKLYSTDSLFHLITSGELNDGIYKVIKEGVIPTQQQIDEFPSIPVVEGKKIIDITLGLNKKELTLLSKCIYSFF